MSKTGIIITLIGLGLFLISIFASDGYDERRTIIGNMYSMEVVIYPGRLEWGKEVEPVPKDEPSGPQSKEKDAVMAIDLKKLRERIESSSPRIVGRISIPLPHLLSLSTIIALVGIGKILLSKKQK
jgi:hypothetical protein